MNWQILDVGSIWLKEFACALAARVPCISWQPEVRWLGYFEAGERDVVHSDPQVVARVFPLQRGYARFPLSAVAPLAPKLLPRLLRQAGDDPARSILICTTPYYAPVAERWPGLVVYYQTDLTVAYAGVHPRQVVELDRRLCRRAEVVCPNSERIAQYFIREAGCDPAKMTIIPNATRQANLQPAPASGPGPCPADVRDLPRPLAGVIGNLAANMDWVFLRDTVRRTPQFSWIFVGPTTMPVYGAEQVDARQELLATGGRVRFLGARPYGELQGYARTFDVAVLPYLRREPTFSGSSTRFYEHLAACRPMIATCGFAELLEKEPLLALVGDSSEAAQALERLRLSGFRDGQDERRWQASLEGTWERRAETMVEAVARYRNTAGVSAPKQTAEPVLSATL